MTELLDQFLKFMTQVQPKDILAAIVLITCLVLITKGINSTFSAIAIMIVTYYFRKRTEDI